MISITVLILLIAALAPGLFIIYYPNNIKFDLKYMLVFAGAFIFSITIVHLLPELMSASSNPRKIGLFVILGFFMQVFLDFTTSGVEHGHIHQHHHGRISPAVLMLGLCLHALTDGTILVHAGSNHSGEHTMGLLTGIVLHKIPATIALMSILSSVLKKKSSLLALLILFSISSPIGLLFSDYLNTSQILDKDGFLILFAIVTGNLLHISTTIYFETSPDHSFHRRKIFISLLGALLAILTEFLHF